MYVVNVEVYLHRDDRWLLIRRGEQEEHAPGILGGPGGKVEQTGFLTDILEETARREVLEEVGVDLTGVAFSYVESTLFTADNGALVINVVLAAALPAGAEPYAASLDEVAGLQWLTAEEALGDAKCPEWTGRALARAEEGRIRSAR
jgi:8-oxo-dGTP diphosphatase